MTLFHYTDVNAVYSILKDRKLRLTDIRFLNDSQELRDGVGCLVNALKNPNPGLFSDRSFVSNSVEYIKKSLEDGVGYGIDSEPIFVCSFSRASNLLSQWRAYGNYALELDEVLLKKHVPNLVECIYDPIEKQNLAIHAITNSITKISKEMGLNDGCLGVDSLDSIASLIRLAAKFKHDGFAEESEARIITSVGEDSESILHTPRGNKLIPYLEVGIPLDCIKAIQIGPMSDQELAYKSMCSYVQRIEKDWKNKTGDVECWLKVEKSSIPFRVK